MAVVDGLAMLAWLLGLPTLCSKATCRDDAALWFVLQWENRNPVVGMSNLMADGTSYICPPSHVLNSSLLILVVN
jgi:hypothetical protein